jgi:hypothetical protein
VTLLVVLTSSPAPSVTVSRHSTFSTGIAVRQTTSAGLAIRQTLSVEK